MWSARGLPTVWRLLYVSVGVVYVALVWPIARLAVPSSPLMRGIVVLVDKPALLASPVWRVYVRRCNPVQPLSWSVQILVSPHSMTNDIVAPVVKLAPKESSARAAAAHVNEGCSRVVGLVSIPKPTEPTVGSATRAVETAKCATQGAVSAHVHLRPLQCVWEVVSTQRTTHSIAAHVEMPAVLASFAKLASAPVRGISPYVGSAVSTHRSTASTVVLVARSVKKVRSVAQDNVSPPAPRRPLMFALGVVSISKNTPSIVVVVGSPASSVRDVKRANVSGQMTTPVRLVRPANATLVTPKH